MDYDVIVRAGCSFMHGDAIENEDGKFCGDKYTASKVLSDYYNCDVDVIANSGYSNGRILRTIYEWVENNTRYKKPLFLIGTSGLARYPIYNEVTKKYWDVNPVAILREKDGGKGYLLRGSFIDKITSGVGTIDEIHQWVTFHMKYVYSDELTRKTLQRNLTMLHYYLKGNNCDYYVLNSIEDGLTDEVKSKLNYVSFIDDEYDGINGDNWKGYLGWQTIAVDGDPKGGSVEFRSPKPPYGKRFCNGHPSPNANKELAERLIKIIESEK